MFISGVRFWRQKSLLIDQLRKKCLKKIEPNRNLIWTEFEIDTMEVEFGFDTGRFIRFDSNRARFDKRLNESLIIDCLKY